MALPRFIEQQYGGTMLILNIADVVISLVWAIEDNVSCSGL